MRRLLEYGGIAASIVLIAFGVGTIVTGFNGRETVRDDLEREQIVGTPDSEIPNQLVNTGEKAEKFANVIRKHTLEATGGRTYAQMGRFVDKNGKETDDEKLAAKDPKTGEPKENEAAADLGDLNGTVDRAQHRLLRRERLHLRNRNGSGLAPVRHRLPRADTAGAATAGVRFSAGRYLTTLMLKSPRRAPPTAVATAAGSPRCHGRRRCRRGR